jgi:hypothetical protein
LKWIKRNLKYFLFLAEKQKNEQANRVLTRILIDAAWINLHSMVVSQQKLHFLHFALLKIAVSIIFIA